MVSKEFPYTHCNIRKRDEQTNCESYSTTEEEEDDDDLKKKQASQCKKRCNSSYGANEEKNPCQIANL